MAASVALDFLSSHHSAKLLERWITCDSTQRVAYYGGEADRFAMRS
jgi:hypothetical protein